jgi:hypothetical protein
MTDQVKELFDTLMCNYDFPAVFAEGLAEFLIDEGYERHPIGHWEIGRFDRTVCSNCGRTFEGCTSNYCCMCGAKMTEETNNEKM